jgi:tetratricopeptide (TPR) repeat protein
MGSALRYAGRIEEAEEALLRAAELRPHMPATYELLTFIYLVYRGMYLDAVRTASKYVELMPNSAKGYSDLGTAYYQLDRMDEAAEAFEKSLGIDSTAFACANLGTIHFGRMRYADAARMYREALRLGGENYRIVGLLAEAYYWSPGRRQLGTETFARAIELLDQDGVLDAGDPTQLSDLASYYARVGDVARSESLLVKAASLEPSELPVLFRIADTYEQLGKREIALEWLEDALNKGAALDIMDGFPGLRELRTDPRYRRMLEGRSASS